MSTFRVGRYKYTEDEIRATGFGHGQDGVVYYPPSRWGRDQSEPDRPAPDWAQQAYSDGYAAGKAHFQEVMNEHRTSNRADAGHQA